ncbi:zinc-ribbon domain-containing protein [Bacteroides finegoldii]|jgi:ribosomal protein L40E|uniref:zinc-ribbon domain-containing protein n=1 Tax=Bacteroides finegoldii TaxID=338188 RepID=UPI00234DD75A|nr:zinc-ribbon domain-containing protein [Bacteroides finegoldii]MDC7141558.1 zinc-ribbon domain-containing protein [Bacteroides finegoldii]
MALVKCNECGNEISSTASRCPKCGTRTLNSKRKRKRFTIIVVAILLFGIMGYAVYSYYDWQVRQKEVEKFIDDFTREHPIY